MRLGQVLLRKVKMKYWQRYVERAMYENSGHRLIRRHYPFVGWKEVKKTDWYYNEHRPWTDEFKRANAPDQKKKKVYVQNIDEWSLFKGDRVVINVGKDKGKIGIVNAIIKERNWVFVDGLNVEYKTSQTTPDAPPTCYRTELPLLVPDQVKLIDPGDNEPTDIEWRYKEDGHRVRVSTRTGRIIPKPVAAEELEDFVTPATYMENTQKDTPAKDVTKVTYEPKLLTFEEELNKIMGIEEPRKRAKTHWY